MFLQCTLLKKIPSINNDKIIKSNNPKNYNNISLPAGHLKMKCELPDYKWTERMGYSDEEIEMFEELLHSNAHLLYKYAENGGIQIA